MYFSVDGFFVIILLMFVAVLNCRSLNVCYSGVFHYNATRLRSHCTTPLDCLLMTMKLLKYKIIFYFRGSLKVNLHPIFYMLKCIILKPAITDFIVL